MNRIEIKRLNVTFSILIILMLSAVTTVLQILMQVSDKAIRMGFYQNPLLFAFNMLPVFLCTCLLYFIFNSIFAGYTITATGLFILLTVNHYKVYFRDEPLIPNDFHLFGEAFGIIKNYDIIISRRVIFIGILFLLIVIITRLFFKARKEKWFVRLIGACVTIVICIVSIKYIYHNQWLFDSFVINENYYNDVSINNSRGFLYNFLYKTTSVYYKKPDGYSPKTAEKYLYGYGKEYTTQQKLPNVIAIMSEAFFDPSDATQIKYYKNMDPMIEFNKLKKSSLYGSLVVPGFAGGTSATEFEFLSGCNLSLIDKSLPTVYRTHITKTTYGLPYVFNELGYRSIAIHPGDKWFYNRENVYKRMGFEKFISKDDLPNDAEKVNWYISDKVTSDLIIDEYKKHLKNHPGQNYFNFTVTIQNHGPYESKELISKPRTMPIDGMSEEMYNTVNNYLNGLNDAVTLLQNVTEYAKSLDEPTVVVFFGDHLPFFDGDFVTYSKIGYNLSDDTIKTLQRKHSVPFIIWSNDSAKELISQENGEILKGDYGAVSANFLPVVLMRYMNMKMPPYFDYVNNIFKQMSVIAPTYFWKDGEFNQFYTKNQLDLLKGYQYLQYYNMRNY